MYITTYLGFITTYLGFIAVLTIYRNKKEKQAKDFESSAKAAVRFLFNSLFNHRRSNRKNLNPVGGTGAQQRGGLCFRMYPMNTTSTPSIRPETKTLQNAITATFTSG